MDDAQAFIAQIRSVEEVADYNQRLKVIERQLILFKWMTVAEMVLLAAVLWQSVTRGGE
jgi:hypothetical protein